MFDINLEGPGGRLAIRGDPSFTLDHKEGAPPHLCAEVLCDASDARLLDVAKHGRVTLRLDAGAGWELVHTGRVRKLGRAGRSVRIETAPATASRDILRRTRTFAAPGSDPCRVGDLPGLKAALAGVQGLDLLDALVDSVTQYRQTDLAFTHDIAWLCGRSVACTDDTIAVQGAAAPGRALTTAAVVADSVAWDVAMEPAAAEFSVWDAASGEAPEPAVALAPQEDWLAGVIAGREFLAPPYEGDYAVAAPGGRTPADYAAQWAAVKLYDAFVWRADLLDFSVRVGDVVRLPAGSAFTGDLRVVRRWLRHDPGAGPDAVTCRVELRPAAGRPAPAPAGALRLHRGEVIHVIDKCKRSRAAVRMPWQRPGAFVLATVPQPCHGAFAAPRPGDWVDLLFLPGTVAAPLVVGVVARGNRPAPTGDGAALVEWVTPEGIVVRLDRKARTIELGLRDGDSVTVWVSITPEGVKVRGDIRMVDGNLIFERKGGRP